MPELTAPGATTYQRFLARREALKALVPPGAAQTERQKLRAGIELLSAKLPPPPEKIPVLRRPVACEVEEVVHEMEVTPLPAPTREIEHQVSWPRRLATSLSTLFRPSIAGS